jgi:T5SS/PEP-CTERM-associated repeat protein/autotransporter-associated beta strand protein
VLSAGSIGGTGEVNFRSLEWTGGAIKYNAQVVIPEDGSLLIDGDNVHCLTYSAASNYPVIDNKGNAVLSGTGGVKNESYSVGGNFWLTYGRLINSGTFDIQSDAGFTQTPYIPGTTDVHGTIENSGLLLKSGGTGTSSVEWNVINTGTLQVQSGTLAISGTFNNTGDIDVQTGALNLSGTLSVGCSGGKTLSVTNGGTVTNSVGYIGYDSGATGMATVSGSGSVWTNSGGLYVGCRGGAILSIINGGTVSNTTGSVGYDSASSGFVTISGTGAKWTSSSYLRVGDSGTGVITQTGGTNSVIGTLYLGYGFTGTGVYNLNGGTLAVGGLASGSGTAIFRFGGGTLMANSAFTSSLPMSLTGTGGNATVNTNGNAVTLSGALSGAGGLKKLGANKLTLTGADTYTGRTTIAAGTLELGSAAWNPVLTAGGAELQTQNLGGGTVTATKLVFNYTGAADPVATIQSLLAASCDGGAWDVGQFRAPTAAALGLTLGYLDDPTAHTVTLVPTYAGDFNLDGIVDVTDLNVWAANAGKSASWQAGDVNYDGAVNLIDLKMLKASIGLPRLSIPSSSAAVPEPSTVVLSAIALLAVIGYRRRQVG